MEPPSTGMRTAPAVRPVASVVMAVWATTGPAAAANPAASVVAKKSRRPSFNGGSRLSYSARSARPIAGGFVMGSSFAGGMAFFRLFRNRVLATRKNLLRRAPRRDSFAAFGARMAFSRIAAALPGFAGALVVDVLGLALARSRGELVELLLAHGFVH